MFAPRLIEEILTHARAEAPLEACGFVVGRTPEHAAYRPCANRAAKPMETFRIAEADYLAHQHELLAVVHSHPGGPAAPTRADMEAQIDADLPYGIAVCNGVQNGLRDEVFWWGDSLPMVPLIGRPFRHGVLDCYSLIRDYYRTKGYMLPEFPRDWDWWKAGEDLYTENFAKAGFQAITEAEVRAGDVFLARLRADRPNHGGVYLGNGLILHHLQDRLSKRDPVNPWRKFFTHWLRHDGQSWIAG